MNLKPIKANMNEVEMGDVRILFSYRTPVALIKYTDEGLVAITTSHYWSRTTSRHINTWLKLHNVTKVTKDDQEFFDNRIKAVA